MHITCKRSLVVQFLLNSILTLQYLANPIEKAVQMLERELHLVPFGKICLSINIPR